MKVVIWGTGKFYQVNKEKIYKDLEVVAFVDNQVLKQGQYLDGIRICAPNELLSLEYDFIFILCAQYMDIRKQIDNMDLPENIRVYDIRQIDMLCQCGSAVFFDYSDKKPKKKKLLVFSHALISTGAQNVLFIGLQILAKQGYEILVVSKSDGVLRERLAQINISVVILQDYRNTNPDMVKLTSWADIILVNTLWLSFLVEELSMFNKPVFWWLHESGALSYIDVRSIRKCLKQDNVHTYAVSNVVRSYIEERTGIFDRIKLLPFGIPEYDNPVVVQKDVAKLVFAIIGGIHYIKGQDIFIEAINKLSEKYKEQAEFWIVGPGCLGDEELKVVDTNRCIKIVGEIDNRKMPELYAQIDVVVCCSREEAMSVTIIEGFMNEKAIIVSERAGVADFVNDGKDGIVMRNEDVDQLCETIMWMIDEPQKVKEMGRKSRKLYDKYFSLSVYEKNILKEMYMM